MRNISARGGVAVACAATRATVARATLRRNACPGGSDELPHLAMLGRGSSASLRAISQAEGIALLPFGIERVEPGTCRSFEAN